MPMKLLEHGALIGEILAGAFLLWRANRALNRLLDVLEQFPPHRHVGKDILYPKGFSPGQVQHQPNGGADAS